MIPLLEFFLNPPQSQWAEICARPAIRHDKLKSAVRKIFEDVQTRGDEALIDLTRKFDGVNLSDLRVQDQEFEEAALAISTKLKAAIDKAYDNIFTFHKGQEMVVHKIETSDGVMCWRESRPIDSVGLYVPGGSVPLFSTVLMLAIPANIAGCPKIQLCTPPQKDGSVNPAVLYAAAKCGVKTVFKLGGAQAIAAMAVGTDQVEKVNKLFGPGNQYVTAAKMMSLDLGIAIDLPAGPSEVLVFSDEGGTSGFIAADLLSQAEHGPDSQVVFVTTNPELIPAVESDLAKQLETLPRQEIAASSLAHSKAILFDSADMAFEFINSYAPEHFIIASDQPGQYVSKINNAGSVFLGNYTPESAGDYASGTNHTLPTAAYAKNYSGVSLDSFIKKITFQQISKSGLEDLGPHIIEMARAEYLEAHARAISVRINKGDV